MELSKPRLWFVWTFALICGMLFCNYNIAMADVVKTQQGVIMKTTSLATSNIIKVPDGNENSVQTSSKVKGNRGEGLEFYGVKSYSSSAGGSNSSSGGGSSVVAFAYKLLGLPYVWGASGPNSFDCSGLTMYVYAHFGIALPHYTGSQFSMGQSISKNNLAPGDLVFFNTYSSISHVGIYIGGGNFIHAPGTGSRVTISNLGEGYFLSAYAGARRYIK